MEFYECSCGALTPDRASHDNWHYILQAATREQLPREAQYHYPTTQPVWINNALNGPIDKLPTHYYKKKYMVLGYEEAS